MSKFKIEDCFVLSGKGTKFVIDKILSINIKKCGRRTWWYSYPTLWSGGNAYDFAWKERFYRSKWLLHKYFWKPKPKCRLRSRFHWQKAEVSFKMVDGCTHHVYFKKDEDARNFYQELQTKISESQTNGPTR